MPEDGANTHPRSTDTTSSRKPTKQKCPAQPSGTFFEVLHYTEKRKYYNPFTEANPIIRYVSPLYSIVYVVANVLFFR